MIEPKTVFNNLNEVWMVPPDLPYFSGHFPGRPIFPAVGIVDASLELIRKRLNMKSAYLKSLPGARFMAPITPETQVKIDLTRIDSSDNPEVSQWSVEWKSSLDDTSFAVLQLEVCESDSAAANGSALSLSSCLPSESEQPSPNVLHENFRVADLLNYIPHRPPMVWIDRVMSFGETSGECLVDIKSGELYLGLDALRPSSCLEFIGQAYGFCWIAYVIRVLDPGSLGMKTAMTAAFKDSKFASPADFANVQPGDELRVKLSNLRRKGPITLIQGQVWKGDLLLAESDLRTFSR